MRPEVQVSPRVVWARRLRVWHRIIGLWLALFCTTLSLTGTFLAFKGQSEYLQPRTRTATTAERGSDPTVLEGFLSPSVIARQVLKRGEPEAKVLSDIDRIELRPSKGVYKVRLKAVSAWQAPRELQLDATTGAVLNDGVRGDQLWLDLHSWAVFGEGTKVILMSLSGISLLWLVGTGIQMWAYPIQVRRRKRVNRLDD